MRFRPFSGADITSLRAVSSAVEHYVDIVVATGSIPVPPTIHRPPACPGAFGFNSAATGSADKGERR